MHSVLFDIRYKMRQFIQGIKNLIKWRKTIWYDRDFDYFYVYEILKKKLEFQRDHIQKYHHHENFQRDIDTLNECIELIDDVQYEECISIELNADQSWTKEMFQRAEECHNTKRKKLFQKIEENIEFWWD